MTGEPNFASDSDLLEYVIEMPCDQGFFVIMYRRKSHKIR